LEPVTHILFGATLGRAGLNRKTGLATLTLAIAAELPDMDMILYPLGPVTGFAHHRGITHTILGAPFMAALACAIAYGIHRLWFTRRGKETRVPMNWKILYCYALLASLSHIFLDFTNNYGVRPFAPFNTRWYSWDIVYIVEPLILLVLTFGLSTAWFLNLIGGEIGVRKNRWPGTGPAIGALVLLCFIWWFRDLQHRKAVQMLESQTYEGAEAIKVSANPYMLTPFHWHGVVETQNFYRTASVNTLNSEVDAQQNGVTHYKGAETAATLAAKKSRLGRVYLDWARHPYVEVETLPMPPGGSIVHFFDLRYAYPGRPLSVLGGAVELDSGNRPIVLKMGTREEKP
jgi:inner membrane protein